jgi:hypothetical protein
VYQYRCFVEEALNGPGNSELRANPKRRLAAAFQNRAISHDVNLKRFKRWLEHFQKYCSHSVIEKHEAVLLGFGVVSAQSQGSFEPAPSPKPRQNPKILAPKGYRIFSKARERVGPRIVTLS